MSKEQKKPTGKEALAILDRLQTLGHISEALFQEQLALVCQGIQGETHTRVEAAGTVQEKRELTPEKVDAAVNLLKTRFSAEKNKALCPSLDWERAQRALRATPEALWTVNEAEQLGHEPTIYFSDETGFDIGTRSDETPASTRDCVFNKEAEQWWEENHPDVKFNENAKDQARAMGWQLMRVEQGRHIAKNTPAYEEKGSSWYETGNDIREAGFALPGHRNGAYISMDSRHAHYHYDDRGWRGSLRVNFVD
ncbi:DUF4256 domain-containing protein [Candidatus Peregrinibacteria bacterium]|nr:DUF4256 domain-containing protein [Candidatus Peregrinibacteria bacterium]